MNYLFKIQKKIVPELISLAELRYTILRNVYYNQPIGRRGLAQRIDKSERRVRNELDFLRSRGLIEVSRSGARITPVGEAFLGDLDDYIKEIKNISQLEEKISNILGLDKVMVVPGNMAHNRIKKELGRFTARFIKNLLQEGDILAVTGGSTLAEVAQSMQDDGHNNDIVVVPGRGGLGEEVEIQANTIAAKIAKKLGGHYNLLHIPDNIKKENIDHIITEPSIEKTLEKLYRANILLHGVGNAEKMAERRNMTQEQINDLLEDGAIGEAFGYYFNSEGDIVHSTTSVGISLDQLPEIEKVIAVAAGEGKAEAIIAAVSPLYQDILITDESTAKEIINLK